MSVLSKTHDELMERARLADEARSSDAVMWESLASVADYLRRIVDHGDTWHYRTDKAGDLVSAAMRVERDAFVGLAGGDDAEDAVIDRLYELHQVADRVVTQLSAARWSVLRTGQVCTWQLRDLHRSGAALVAMIDKLAATAIEDPDGAR